VGEVEYFRVVEREYVGTTQVNRNALLKSRRAKGQKEDSILVLSRNGRPGREHRWTEA